MCLTKLLTSNNEIKTLQSNHVPPRTDSLVWLRGNAALSHPCRSLGSSYEEFPIPDGLVRSSQPTVSVDDLRCGIDDAKHIRLLEMISIGNLRRGIDGTK